MLKNEVRWYKGENIAQIQLQQQDQQQEQQQKQQVEQQLKQELEQQLYNQPVEHNNPLKISWSFSRYSNVNA